jgi:superfamily I DNA/RNA helicase
MPPDLTPAAQAREYPARPTATPSGSRRPSARYRNTVEILATARAVVAADAYDDVDVAADSGERDVEVVRHGDLPTTGTYGSTEEHDDALLWDLQALGDRGVAWSEVAVLCQTNDETKEYARRLNAAGVPTVLLSSAKAGASDAVQVGTWFRSKGMEFSHVFLPQVDRPTMLLTGADELAQQEKAELLRRTLYVAMTRARDTLWVGRCVSAGALPDGSNGRR